MKYVWFALALLLAIFALAIFSGRPPAPVGDQAEIQSAPPAPGKIRLTVQKAEYSYGYLRVAGVARNIGAGPAVAPMIEIEVYSGSTLMARGVTFPAGHSRATLPTGGSAAFEHILSIPGSPPMEQLRTHISVKNHPYELAPR